MHRVVELAVVVAAALGTLSGDALAQPAEQATSTALPLYRVAVELPSLDVASVVLHAAPAPTAIRGPFAVQRLRLGGVEIPLAAPAVIVRTADTTAVKIEVQLRTVPDRVLGLPLERVPVSWEGSNEAGHEALTVAGTINPTDPASLDVPLKVLYDKYTRIADVRMFSDGGGMVVRVLASLYNPFTFDLTATMLDYSVRAGEKQIIAGQRRGFRLRGRRWSDVVIEQDVAPAEAAAGGFAALLRPSSVQVEGRMSIRTPTGDRALALKLGS